MRRITLLTALVLAGCGGGDEAPAPERITAHHLGSDSTRLLCIAARSITVWPWADEGAAGACVRRFSSAWGWG